MQIVATQGLLRIVIQIFPRTLMTTNLKLQTSLSGHSHFELLGQLVD
jgi:hypothetical protein